MASREGLDSIKKRMEALHKRVEDATNVADELAAAERIRAALPQTLGLLTVLRDKIERDTEEPLPSCCRALLYDVALALGADVAQALELAPD